MLFSVSVYADDCSYCNSCKLTPVKDNEMYCWVEVKDGIVVAITGAPESRIPYIKGRGHEKSSIPYLDGHKMTVMQFDHVNRNNSDYIYVEGDYDSVKNIVTISKFKKFEESED